MTTPALECAARAAREYMESMNADEHTADVLTLGVARAVLMAVREPDWEWTADVAGTVCDEPYSSFNPNPKLLFTAMIDAILGEGEGE